MIKTHASLFSGIGGAEIAASWMGWDNVFHCEIQEFPRKVLEYWYPNAVSYEDITKTDFTSWRGKIDILTGGFPCQAFSMAGKRLGDKDHRYLWPEMLRAIREIQPSWVVGENVTGLLSMVQSGEEAKMGRTDDIFEENHIYRKEQRFTLDEICEGLERAGYAVQPFVVPACAVGAPHRRDRIWIVARRIQDPVAHSADAGAETMQCGRENGVHATGTASDTDINRQRERTHQQVTVAGCKGASYDCTCSQDGAASDTNEHRRTPCREGGRIETEREERFALPGEREVWSQRPDRFPGLSRNATYTQRIRRYACELHDGEPEKPQQAARRAQQPLGTDCPQDWWRDFPTQSPVCSRDDELSARLAGITFPRWRAESIKALGNAMVPAVVYEIFRAIAQVENEKNDETHNTATG